MTEYEARKWTIATINNLFSLDTKKMQRETFVKQPRIKTIDELIAEEKAIIDADFLCQRELAEKFEAGKYYALTEDKVPLTRFFKFVKFKKIDQLTVSMVIADSFYAEAYTGKMDLWLFGNRKHIVKELSKEEFENIKYAYQVIKEEYEIQMQKVQEIAQKYLKS